MKPKARSEKHIALFQQANKLHQGGQLLEALARYKKLLQTFPHDAELLERIGTLTLQQGHAAQSLQFLRRSVQLAPRHALAQCSMGIALGQLSQLDEALAAYSQAICVKPDFVEAYINRGIAYCQKQQYEMALTDYDRAITLRPNNPMAHNYRGLVKLELAQLEDALRDYEIAISLRHDYAEAYVNRGDLLQTLNRFEEAIQDYDKAIALNPDYCEAYFKKANVLHELKKPDQALQSYHIALALNPLDAEILNNTGLVCLDLQRTSEALDSFDQAIKLNPVAIAAYINKATALNNLKRYPESLACFEKAVAINPDYEFVPGEYIFAKLQICEWSNIRAALSEITAKIESGAKAALPLHVILFKDSLSLQQAAAQTWIKDKFPKDANLPLSQKHPAHQRLRLAYISEDFCVHPVTSLTAQLFERHDRNQFEVFAFSYGSDKDEMTSRLENAFDRFIDIQNLTDQEVVRLARELEIDIAIDLAGYTGDCRTGLFAHRIAPLQVNYLGYPGSMATDYMDYIIADKILIPEAAQRQFYAEKIVYMPNSFQVNDNTRSISVKEFTREEFGLPESGFVYCCFNNPYKINPDNFQIWMRILANVVGSVLWLPGNNAGMIDNLKKAAMQSGIDPGRLIFASRMAQYQDHLARLKLADLFLDTFPYNAHATASDALWAGLPLLTCAGESYANRVSASLLTAINLPDLITASLDVYEAKAIQLANDREQLNGIRARLQENRLTTPLFDTQLFTKHLEAGFIQMYQRNQAGLPADDIEVSLSGIIEKVH